jgi:Lon protease-like protein
MPLNAVLFPGMPMPLMLWEPRYLRMAEYCLQNETPFGVVLIKDGPEIGDDVAETYGMGTTAEIAHYRDRGDHAMIMAVGRRRFKLLGVFEHGDYPEAEVELLHEKGAGVSPELLEDIRGLFAEEVDLILQLLGFEGAEMEIPTQADKLSYMIAAHLRVPLDAKQALLEIEHCSQRLARELDLVRKEREEYRMLLAARNLAEQWSDTVEPGSVFSDN